jgi:hypothetical protein
MTREPVGSVAEEAAKLFAVLQHDPHASSHESASPYESKAAPECQWCPVCQFLRLVKHSGPETVEHLASAAAGVLTSVRALMDAAAESARQAQAARAESTGTTSEDPGPQPHPGVDRIDVSEDPEPWD